MIVKTFQLNSSKLLNSFILFYGNNDGYKNDIIEQLILKNFDGEILKYDEYEVLINKEDFFVSNV